MIRSHNFKRSPLRRATPLKRSRKRLKIRIRKRDLEWARAVKERDKWACRRCGKFYPHVMRTEQFEGALRGLHACHIFGRSRQATRYDMDNGMTWCMGCHLFYHAHPLEMIEFAKRELGEAKFEQLRRRAMGIEENATVTG